MTPDRLICVTTTDYLGKQKTSFHLLSKEVNKFAEAMARATEEGKPQKVKVDDELDKFIDIFSGVMATAAEHAGREIKPAG